MKRFFGWLFMTQGYLDTLTDEELLIRACSSKREAYVWGWRAREIEKNSQRLTALMDRLQIEVLAVPYVRYAEPPAPSAVPQTPSELREQARKYDVRYEAVKP